MNKPNLTVSDALAIAIEQVGDATAAQRLIGDCIAQTYSWVGMNPDANLSAEQATRLRGWLERAASGEPLPYVSGVAGFWTLELDVSPDVLIPRPDTETLVQTALTHAPQGEARVLDLGTGSGAVALALASERPSWSVTATDLSPDALEIARANARNLGCDRVDLLEGRWYEAVQGQVFDIIVSNPPYVAEGDPDLDDSVREHEPASAVFAKDDGLADLRAIIFGASTHLINSGWLGVEHGHLQGEAVRALFVEAGFGGVLTEPDLTGRERVTHGRRVI